MSTKTRLKGSIDFSHPHEYGYYAYIEDGELFVGDDFGREGGIFYRGDKQHDHFGNREHVLKLLDAENKMLYESVKNYFSTEPLDMDTHAEDRLKDLAVGSEFMRLEDDNTYRVIDGSIRDCFNTAIDKKLIPVLNLKDYKVHLFHEDTIIRR